MADIIDLIVAVSKGDDGKNLAKEFLSVLGKKDPKELEKWLIDKGYKDISLEDCEKLISNQDAISKLGDTTIKNGY